MEISYLLKSGRQIIPLQRDAVMRILIGVRRGRKRNAAKVTIEELERAGILKLSNCTFYVERKEDEE